MVPDLFSIDSYDFKLPPELIAQAPTDQRSDSKLMLLDRFNQTIEHKRFYDLTSILRSGDLLVVNNSRVIPARLYGYKDNGTRIEVLIMYEIEPLVWKAMVHPGKRLKDEQVIYFNDDLSAQVGKADDEGFRTLTFIATKPFWSILEQIGHTPLPPYIQRNDNDIDKERYQTVYAQSLGSIAAPTAGLHFSEKLLEDLKRKGIVVCYVTLHVGLGTFKPVNVSRIDQHKMHREHCVISEETAKTYNYHRKSAQRIIAVGTTSLRTLQSFYCGGEISHGEKWTDIFLHPGKSIDSIDGLITNFHLPKSTLLMLVSAFAGYEYIRHAYYTAIQSQYRFFSYGDAMLIL